MKKTYIKPVVMKIASEELGAAYYGAMASSCNSRGQRC